MNGSISITTSKPQLEHLPHLIQRRIIGHLDYMDNMRLMLVNSLYYTLVNDMKQELTFLSFADCRRSQFGFIQFTVHNAHIHWKSNGAACRQSSLFVVRDGNVEFNNTRVNSVLQLGENEGELSLKRFELPGDSPPQTWGYFLRKATKANVKKIDVDLNKMTTVHKELLAKHFADAKFSTERITLSTSDIELITSFLFNHLPLGMKEICIQVYEDCIYETERDISHRSYRYLLPMATLDCEVIKTVDSLVILWDSDVDDRLLCELIARKIILKGNITELGIDKLLNEWKKGFRRLDKVEIRSDQITKKYEPTGFNHFVMDKTDRRVYHKLNKSLNGISKHYCLYNDFDDRIIVSVGTGLLLVENYSSVEELRKELKRRNTDESVEMEDVECQLCHST